MVDAGDSLRDRHLPGGFIGIYQETSHNDQAVLINPPPVPMSRNVVPSTGVINLAIDNECKI